MGLNTLPVAVDENIIPAEHHNALTEAFLLDLVPRNASRQATSDGGQLGTSLYRWLRLYIKEIIVGTTSENLRIHSPNSKELWLENTVGDSVRLIEGSVKVFIGGAEKFSVEAAELVTPEQYINQNSIKTNAKVATGYLGYSEDTTGDTHTVPISGTTTITNALAGKVLKVTVYTFWNSLSASPGSDVFIKINGSTVKTDHVASPEIMASRVHTIYYTVPSDGSYTLSVTARRFHVFNNGSFTMEEI